VRRVRRVARYPMYIASAGDGCEEGYDFSLWVRLGTYKQCSVPIGTSGT
jgi:hypothetical protein